MIRVEIELSEDGVLKRIKANGHAGWNVRGRDIVCAAASSLIRTAGGLLFNEKKLCCRGNVQENPGIITLEIREKPESLRLWIKGVSDFLLKGLLDLEKEYSKNIEIRVMKMTDREESNGS